jgi:hypothetical protein
MKFGEFIQCPTNYWDGNYCDAQRKHSGVEKHASNACPANYSDGNQCNNSRKCSGGIKSKRSMPPTHVHSTSSSPSTQQPRQLSSGANDTRLQRTAIWGCSDADAPGGYVGLLLVLRCSWWLLGSAPHRHQRYQNKRYYCVLDYLNAAHD